MSIDPSTPSTARSHETRPALPLVLALAAWAALVYVAYAVSYVG